MESLFFSTPTGVVIQLRYFFSTLTEVVIQWSFFLSCDAVERVDETDSPVFCSIAEGSQAQDGPSNLQSAVCAQLPESTVCTFSVCSAVSSV